MNDPLVDALALLPHGPEFRFIDRLTRLTPGVEAEGDYTLRGDEPFLKGHFPGNPILPGVLLVEAAAQLAGVAGQSDPVHGPLPGLKLADIRAARILGAVKPGETVALRAVVTARMGRLIQASVSGRIGDKAILKCEVTMAGEQADAY